ncbi:MAG TPA: hypothetical protein VK766_07945, partial [Cytophagaceae bacterium]|nr:hypothetical protein [Cytophagaceae bacterium]
SAFSLYGIMIAGLLYWNYNQFQEQKLLRKSIESLQESLLQASNNKGTTKNDTVFIVKYVDKSELLSLKEDGKNLNGSKKGSSQTAYKNSNYRGQHDSSISDKLMDATSDSKNNTTDGPSATSKNQFIDNKKQRSNDFSESSSNRNQNPKEDLNNKDRSISALQDNNDYFSKNVSQNDNGTDSTVSSSNQKNAVANPTQNEKNNASQLTSTPFMTNPVTLVKPDSVAAKTIIPDVVREDTTKRTRRQKTSFLKNIHYLAGIGVEKANSQFGIGVLGEVFLTKRISFNAGFKYLSISNHYHDRDDFNQKTNTNFNSIYSDYQDTLNLSNIQMQYNVLQIPVAVNYYLPLKNNFSLIFSGGTDLDVFSNLKIQCVVKGYYNQDIEERKSLTLKYHPVLFNNVMLSTGVQKQWNNIVIQASPFVSPQLKTVEYKRDNVYAGLRVRILYKF